jgi:hypothetical protein
VAEKSERGTMRLILAVFLFLSIFSVIQTPAKAATPIGEVVAVGGSPRASGPGGKRVLGPGADIFEDDRITTGSGGNAQLLFVDGTKLVVGPSSTLVISRFLLRSPNRAKTFSIDALRGTFRFISGRSAKSAYDIKTSNASIGIRGTAFDFASRGTTTLAVFSGLTSLCSGGNCTDVGARCEVGRVSGGRSRLLTGGTKRLAIQSNLPFILNQSALSVGFRLNTSACGRVAARPSVIDSQSDESKPQPQPSGKPSPPSDPDPDPDPDPGCSTCN